MTTPFNRKETINSCNSNNSHDKKDIKYAINISNTQKLSLDLNSSENNKESIE